LAISGARWIYSHWATGFGDWPDELLIPMWAISAVCALWMAYTGQSLVAAMESSTWLARWLKQPLGMVQANPLRLFRYAGYLTVIGVVLIGIVIEMRVARENLHITDPVNAEETVTGEIMAPEVEAGVWLHSHTPQESVVMARHWPTVYHYAQRKLIWFAPISDPGALLDGILRHGVDYVVVVHHASPYYLPDDDYCFERLSAAHAESFRLVFQTANLRIFRFEKKS
jgi:hypothetical protein